jgi:hypothetical protein
MLNLKARVDVRNVQLKATKAALRLSQHLIHAMMFEVGLLLSVTYNHKTNHQGGSDLFDHRCPAIRFTNIDDQ